MTPRRQSEITSKEIREEWESIHEFTEGIDRLSEHLQGEQDHKQARIEHIRERLHGSTIPARAKIFAGALLRSADLSVEQMSAELEAMKDINKRVEKSGDQVIGWFDTASKMISETESGRFSVTRSYFNVGRLPKNATLHVSKTGQLEIPIVDSVSFMLKYPKIAEHQPLPPNILTSMRFSGKLKRDDLDRVILGTPPNSYLPDFPLVIGNQELDVVMLGRTAARKMIENVLPQVK